MKRQESMLGSGVTLFDIFLEQAKSWSIGPRLGGKNGHTSSLAEGVSSVNPAEP
jgi:hypothetical protein